jgi:hypothetical protein
MCSLVRWSDLGHSTYGITYERPLRARARPNRRDLPGFSSQMLSLFMRLYDGA